MSIYTVHVPPSRRDRSAPDPESFVFVRDGFSFWAFLLAPLWMLRHRLWLVLAGYLIVATLLQIGLGMIGASSAVMFAAGALLALLVGLEAATLRRITLARRGWKNIGIVIGDDLESAERRFFDAWVGSEAPASPAAMKPGPIMGAPAPHSEIIGLFPHAGASR